jgi:hypothetical protein
MRYELKSIGVWAFLKVAFFLNLIIGFVIGLFYSLFLGFFLLVFSSVPFSEPGLFPVDDQSLGVLFFILPFLFSIGAAVLHTLAGVVVVLIYNLLARLVGGFEMDLKPVDIVPTPPPATGPMYAQSSAPVSSMPPPPPPSTDAPPPPPRRLPPDSETPLES